jgi:hypothetical protein
MDEKKLAKEVLNIELIKLIQIMYNSRSITSKQVAPNNLLDPNTITLIDCVSMIGFIGGFFKRRTQPYPGLKSVWNGFRDVMQVYEFYPRLVS